MKNKIILPLIIISLAGSLDLAAKGSGAVRTTSKLAYSHETLNTASPTVSQAVPLTIFDRGGAIAAGLGGGV